MRVYCREKMAALLRQYDAGSGVCLYMVRAAIIGCNENKYSFIALPSNRQYVRSRRQTIDKSKEKHA